MVIHKLTIDSHGKALFYTSDGINHWDREKTEQYSLVLPIKAGALLELMDNVGMPDIAECCVPAQGWLVFRWGLENKVT